jgi:hypothetical protein
MDVEERDDRNFFVSTCAYVKIFLREVWCVLYDLAGCAGEKPAEQRCGADAGHAGSSFTTIDLALAQSKACGGDVMC